MSTNQEQVVFRGRGTSDAPRPGTTNQGPRSNHVNSDNWRLNAGPPQGEAQTERFPRDTFAGIPSGNASMGPGMTGSAAPTSISSTTIVSISEERTREGADPHNPLFLAHIENRADRHVYNNVVLPLVTTLVFKIDCAPDLHFFDAILKSNHHPRMVEHVRKLSLSGFHWFSGVLHNRTHHPMLAFASSLPNLQELGMTFHTAGLTASMWPERDRVRMEESDFEKSKQLRVLRVQDIVNKYGLAMLFRCGSLTAVHLECIRSDMVEHYAQGRDPTGPFFGLVRWAREGFTRTCGTSVAVTTRVLQK